MINLQGDSVAARVIDLRLFVVARLVEVKSMVGTTTSQRQRVARLAQGSVTARRIFAHDLASELKAMGMAVLNTFDQFWDPRFLADLDSRPR